MGYDPIHSSVECLSSVLGKRKHVYSTRKFDDFLHGLVDESLRPLKTNIVAISQRLVGFSFGGLIFVFIYSNANILVNFP